MEAAPGQRALHRGGKIVSLVSRLHGLSLKSCLFPPPQGDDGEVGPRGLPGEPVSLLTVGDSVAAFMHSPELGINSERRLERAQL